MASHGGPASGFEIIEHTADVGIRAWGPAVDECLAQATLGLFEIVGIWHPERDGERVSIEVSARDRAALLAEWLNEVLYEYEARDAVATRVAVEEVTDTTASGAIWLADRGEAVAEGTQVKAVTYHRLQLEEVGERWSAQVYVDV